MSKFKDACDLCGKMDFCVGYKGKVLCPTCLKKEEETNGKKHKD